MGSHQTVVPYHINVPSFGEWGFVMLGPKSRVGGPLRKGLKTQFLDDNTFSAMVHFPRDLTRLDVDANRLTTAVVAEYYREGWSAFN